MKRSVTALKEFFKTHDKPTEQQFADWLDSYVHKDELQQFISSAVEGVQVPSDIANLTDLTNVIPSSLGDVGGGDWMLDNVVFNFYPEVNEDHYMREGFVVSTLQIEIADGWDFIAKKVADGWKPYFELLRWKPARNLKLKEEKTITAYTKPAKWVFESRPEISERVNRIAISKPVDFYDFGLEKWLTGVGKKYRYGKDGSWRFMIFGLRMGFEKIGSETHRTGVVFKFRANHKGDSENMSAGGRVGISIL